MAELRIPYRDRDQRIVDAVDELRAVVPDRQERQVLRNLLIDRLAAGDRRMADVLDHLESASREERRAAVDQAREASGLQSLGAVEYEQYLATRSLVEPRDSRGRVPAFCRASGCMNFLPNPEMPGAPAMTTARKWCCSAHADQGDFTPWTGPRLAFGPSGAIVDLDEIETERERQRTEAERRRRRRDEERAERALEAAEAERNERARRERFMRESAHQRGAT